MRSRTAVSALLAVALLAQGCMGRGFSFDSTALSSGPNASTPARGPGNGEGYEGISKFRAYDFSSEDNACHVPYSRWIDWQTTNGTLWDACETVVPKSGLVRTDVEWPQSYNVEMVGLFSHVFEIRDSKTVDLIPLDVQDLTVSWCRKEDSANPKLSIDIVVRKTGGQQMDPRATIYYAIPDGAGKVKVGKIGPFPVEQIDAGIRESYQAPGFLTKNLYGTGRPDGTDDGEATVTIEGKTYNLIDMRCRHEEYY